MLRGVEEEGRGGGSSAVPDVLAPGLRCVFCGSNPGRVSAAAAAHFANPRNDFWRLLHDAGFTPRLYAPAEQFELPELGEGRPWRRRIDTALDSPDDIVPWPSAPAVSGPLYRAGARSVVMLYAVGQSEANPTSRGA